MYKFLVLSALMWQAPTGSIEGVVLGTGNRPLAGAQVTALWFPSPVTYRPEEVPRAVTDDQGRFAIRDLPSGGYRINVRAGGYVTQIYKTTTGDVISLAAGQSLEGLALRMVADGIISGRITSTNGSPLVGMDVSAVRKAYHATGWSEFIWMASAVTDDRGEYRIAGLGAGGYYVVATSPLINNGPDRPLGPFRGADASPGVYGSAFYPGVSESSKAEPVQLEPGQQSTKIDIAIPRLGVYKVRGRIRDGAGLPTSRVMVSPRPAGLGQFVRGLGGVTPGPAWDPSGTLISPYRPDGTFELNNVPPGEYWIYVQLEANFTPEQRQLASTPGADLSSLTMPGRGSTRIRVIDSDVENVEIEVVHKLAVEGTIAVEGGLSVTFSDLKPELWAVLAGRINSPVGRATISPEGTFTYTNTPAGEYLFTLTGVPADFYLKEGRLGSTNVLGHLLDLSRQPVSPLQIVLAKGSEVSGMLTDGDSNPVANQEVVLVPDRLANRADLYRTATTDANGRFRMRGVAPGEYRAFAWRTIEAFRYFDPEFVRGYYDLGSAVRVTETSPPSVRVNLIP